MSVTCDVMRRGRADTRPRGRGNAEVEVEVEANLHNASKDVTLSHDGISRGRMSDSFNSHSAPKT